MTAKVVVLGSGYAGAGAIKKLESELTGADITWVSDTDYHLVLHESHRVIRDPGVKDKITIPVHDIKAPSTTFVKGEVTNLDTDERVVELADETTIDYDYVLVALGSGTAYYGIPGLEENALTLKCLDDALEINEQVTEAARNASRNDPVRIAVGGAGLSGIQSAGELAEFRDKHRAPIEITLIEALPEIMPGQDPELQQLVRQKVEAEGISILTDDPITEADESTIYFDEGEPFEYDVFIWTGGITGRPALEGANVEKQHNRVNVSSTFQTDDERVFAIGDSAIIDQGENPAPPTAQAAWQAAEVAGKNIANEIHGRPLRRWTYKDKGTVMSIGENAVAHNVQFVRDLPVDDLQTFDGYPAQTLKKLIAARWIADITSWPRAMSAWSVL